MTVNVGKFLSTVHDKNIESCDEKNLLIYARTLQQLKLGAVFTVNNFVDLPSALFNNGKLYYIKNLQSLVWSNGSSWNKLGSCNRSVWSWGNNNTFQLGIGNSTTIARCSPVREFCSATDWCALSSGDASLAIKVSGELWGWGCNNGTLGSGSFIINTQSPIREFCSATDWCQVSTVFNSSAAIKTNGQLFTWGCNSYGKLGIGISLGTARCSAIREFCSASDWCQVNVSVDFMAAIKTSGQLWSWGRNLYGRIGDGTTILRCSPVREFCSATNWCQISLGHYHSSAIKSNGELWTWGRNTAGQLGVGTSVTVCSPVREFCSASDWSKVSAGRNFTTALKTSGQIWSFGSNTSGALGIGNSATIGRCSPVREFCSATDWCHVTSGCYISAAIKTSGQLLTWGSNNCGALGIGNSATIGRCSPVREFCSSTDWLYVTTNPRTVTMSALKIEKYI